MVIIIISVIISCSSRHYNLCQAYYTLQYYKFMYVQELNLHESCVRYEHGQSQIFI
jgi:hypothetical protein